MLNPVARIWAFPNTLIGLAIGWIGLCFGGRYEYVAGCHEFHGPLVRWLLKKMPTGTGAAAITLGHTILGQTENDLIATRAHEHVHVRQYERWGPIFIPAYFTASLIACLRGRDAYRGNFFEIEAYSTTEHSPGEFNSNDSPGNKTRQN